MFEEELSRGLEGLDISLTAVQQQQLLAYLTLLSRWNKTYNLTAVRDERAMITRHLLDSLAVLGHLKGQRFIDVGTGAGLPGIPLAIASPQKHFALLDSNGKKTRFLVHVANELGLSNVEPIKSRVTDYKPTAAYDMVLSRAFASLSDMIASCQHLLTFGGVLLAMKGQVPEEELQRIDSKPLHVAIIDLQIPGLSEDRCLVQIRPNADNNLK